MVVGDPAIFAIESSITRPFAHPGQRALGFFLIHVGGKRYGVRKPEATLLACSFDEVRDRISRRGTHRAAFGSEPVAAKIIDAVRAALYDEERQGESFFGLTAEGLQNVLYTNEIVWAPDGDAAFDDSGHVLQFDLGDQVRLIAFHNTEHAMDALNSMAEVCMDANEFYALLEEWQSRFEAEWAAALQRATKH